MTTNIQYTTTYLQDIQENLMAKSNSLHKDFLGYKLIAYTDGTYELEDRESQTMYIILGNVYTEYLSYSNEFEIGYGYKRYYKEHNVYNMDSTFHYISEGITASLFNLSVLNLWKSGHRLGIIDERTDREYYFPLAPKATVFNAWVKQAHYLKNNYDNIYDPIFRALQDTEQSDAPEAYYSPLKEIMVEIQHDRTIDRLAEDNKVRQQELDRLVLEENLTDIETMPVNTPRLSPIVNVHLKWTEEKKAYVSEYQDYTWNRDHRKDTTFYKVTDLDTYEEQVCNAWLAKHNMLEDTRKDNEVRLERLEELEELWNQKVLDLGFNVAYETYRDTLYDELQTMRGPVNTTSYGVELSSTGADVEDEEESI